MPEAVVADSTATMAPGSGSATVETESAPKPYPRFRSSTSRIDSDLRHRMRWSWRQGCPVPLRKLRYVIVSYVGFGGHPRRGELVVHRSVAPDMVDVMHRLYRHRFPIHRMQLVDDFEGDDRRSMRNDNTSAFNCRKSTGSSGTWSQHSFGRAIDVNPVENPYVSSSGLVLPRNGARFADRSLRHQGMIRRRSIVVRAFASVGWEWGGRWTGSKDYQHLSLNGR